MSLSALIEKYDVPAPRYTSYPTVPYWCDSPTSEEWVSSLDASIKQEQSIAYYVHLPFCETLCTFCGCNTVITRNHAQEFTYLEALQSEFRNYARQIKELNELSPVQVHLGGGTPTYFSANNIKTLLSFLIKNVSRLPKNFEGSVEVDPRHCSEEQLQVFREFGFKRLSMGVQDFSAEVQRAVNRIQPFEMTERIVSRARQLGFESVNFDLIYGLPKQTTASVVDTIKKTLELRPDRIAFYSFAVVPWMKPAQNHMAEFLPRPAEKREIFEIGRQLLLDAGYFEIGMDHFALPDESLTVASKEGRLHRNFMGYVETRSSILLGLGVSAISESHTCYHQNVKELPEYYNQVQAGRVPTFRGHKLSIDDQLRRNQILALMTKFEVELLPNQFSEVRSDLASMIADGLVSLDHSKLKLLPDGKPFLRNACVVLDQRMRAAKAKEQLFSKVV